MSGDSAIEAQVRSIAAEIAAAGSGEDAGVFHLSWWSERMLDWAMAHPEFKTRLFRFVDVFPACHSSAEVERHLEEYLDGVEAPRAVDFGLNLAERAGALGAVAATRVARSNIERMARQFIVGEGPAEALGPLERLWRAGEAFTVDLLGEKVVTAGEADGYATRVVEMLDELSTGVAAWPGEERLERDPWGDLPRVNVSVKPTALAPRLSPLTRAAGLDEAMERLAPILDRARALGATVHFDTEHYDVKDMTLELVRRVGEAYPEGPQLGAVVQAYLRDAFVDLQDLIVWSHATLATPLQVRLVKGAYWDHEVAVAAQHGWPPPVFDEKGATDRNYERCVDLLLDRAGDVRPAFGTHNLRSLAYAVAGARARDLAEGAYELQLLYGMAEPVHAGLRALGQRVRVYAPVGELVPGMAYLIRRLLENTSNESFVRMRFAEGADLETLLERPPPVPDGADDHAESPTAPTDPESPAPFAPEPHAEFRRPGPRARMGAAVEGAPSGFPQDAPVIIDGHRCDTEGEIVSVDPGANDRMVARSGSATPSDADIALEVAEAAQPAWAARTARERAAVLFRAAELMRGRRAELAALEVFEAGKPWAEADADVCEAVDFLEYYGREALRLAGGAPVEQVPGEVNDYRYEPRGVGVVISPWNFPLAIPTGMVTGPLVMGNAVLFKPAEQAPGLAHRLFEILLEAGCPSGVLAFLPGRGEDVGAHLVEHAAVRWINFTGSRAIGLDIVDRAAVPRPGQRHVKAVVAEMGGKNAVIVDADADLDAAIPAVVASAFGYAGQKCSACSRLIVLDAVFDQTLERLVGATRLLRVGHPAAMGTQVGPLIDADAFERLGTYRRLASDEGEVVLARDDVPDGGWYVGPTIVVAPPGCRVTTEEIFGPFLTVIRVADLDEAITVANDSDYGLTGGIFSRSPSHVARAAAELQVGNLYVNRSVTGAIVGRQPFGGVRLSGVGSKAGGPDYLRQFTEPRVVTENTMRQGFAPLEG